MKNIGDLIDKLFKINNSIDEAKNKLKLLEAQYDAHAQLVEEALLEQELSGAKGRLAEVSLKEVSLPTAKNWDDIYKFIIDSGSFDILQKRLSSTAINERVEDGIKIPGVVFIISKKLKLSKRK